MPSDSKLPPFDHEYTFSYTTPPNPVFNYGDPVSSTDLGKVWLEGLKEGWQVYDTTKTDTKKLYKLMVGAISPRPIAFVSTLSEDGTPNLAPYSWFNQVTANPPIISIAVQNITPDGVPHLKDTGANIKALKEFTVNIASEPFIENATTTSLEAPSGVDEWELSGLTRAPSIYVRPPRILESAFSMECTLYAAYDIPSPTCSAVSTTLILGHVKYIHVRKDVMTDRERIDPAKLRAVSMLGSATYARIGAGFRLDRPRWEDEKEKIESSRKDSSILQESTAL